MFVYIIAFDVNGPCKIGVSRSPQHRLMQLQDGNPYELHVAYIRRMSPDYLARLIECRTHKALAALRLKGEWFKTDVDNAKYIINTFANRIMLGSAKPLIMKGDFEHSVSP